jgi:uncharacterized membrane protein
MNKLTISRLLTLSGYFGLLGWLLISNTLLMPSHHFPIALVLSVLVLPLTLFMTGLLNANLRTHILASYIALIYLALGISDIFAYPTQRIYGILEVLCCLMWYGGALWYVKLCLKPKKPEC